MCSFPCLSPSPNDHGYSQRSKTSTAASKKNSGSITDLTESQLSDSYFKQLRHKLYCITHKKLCLVRQNGSALEHEELDDLALGYWARMIVGTIQWLFVTTNRQSG